MALKINNTIVKEDIEDLEGKKIGEIKFNPKDAKIMKLLSDTVRNLMAKLNEQKSLGEIKNLDNLENDLNSYEEFEENLDNLEKINKSIDLEYAAISETIENFEKVFGKETMDIITGGSMSIDNIVPLLEFVYPYVKEYRQEYIGKYTHGNSTIFK